MSQDPENVRVAQIVKSQNGTFLHIDGYLYYKHSGTASRRYWNCRRKGECGARAITVGDDDNLVVYKGPLRSPHNHAPNLEAVQATKIRGRIKRKAEEHAEMPPAQILRRELRDVPSEILAELPDRPNLRKHISRTRLRNMPPNPVRISDLEEIPAQYRQTLGGHTFLLYDSWEDDSDSDDNDDDDDSRILIFSTKDNLIQLFKCNIWFVDGTFKTAPSIFFQLFSILGAVNQIGINRKPQTVGLPFVHALLENKQQKSYTKVFNVVLRKARKFRIHNLPEHIMSDFEIPINAAKEIFGQDSVKCCFFHFCQNIYRHVVSEGLQGAYNGEDRRIKKGVHMLCALVAFVPLDQVECDFRELRDVIPDELNAVDYFEANYIRRRGVRRRQGGCGITVVNRSPRYPVQLWNHYGSVLEGTARTNNLSEGWHNRFQLVVGKHHPSLYVFFDELKKEQADTEIMLSQLQLGQRIRKGIDKNRRQLEEQIQNIVQDCSEYRSRNDILTYLKLLGYLIKF